MVFGSGKAWAAASVKIPRCTNENYISSSAYIGCISVCYNLVDKLICGIWDKVTNSSPVGVWHAMICWIVAYNIFWKQY